MTTAYHCDKLCSCATCESLRWAIDYARREFGEDDSLWMVYEKNGAFRRFPYKAAILAAIHDPAKLAELLAMGLRARGWFVYDADPGDALRLPAATIEVDEDVVHVELFADWESCRAPAHGSPLSTPEVRVKLLAIMAIEPNESSREVVKAMMRGEK